MIHVAKVTSDAFDVWGEPFLDEETIDILVEIPTTKSQALGLAASKKRLFHTIGL